MEQRKIALSTIQGMKDCGAIYAMPSVFNHRGTPLARQGRDRDDTGSRFGGNGGPQARQHTGRNNGHDVSALRTYRAVLYPEYGCGWISLLAIPIFD